MEETAVLIERSQAGDKEARERLIEENLDLVARREKMLFETFAPKGDDLPENAKVIGINRSFYTNTYFPLYSQKYSHQCRKH